MQHLQLNPQVKKISLEETGGSKGKLDVNDEIQALRQEIQALPSIETRTEKLITFNWHGIIF